MVRLFETGLNIPLRVIPRQALWIVSNNRRAGFQAIQGIHNAWQHIPFHFDQFQRLIANLRCHGDNNRTYLFVFRFRFVEIRGPEPRPLSTPIWSCCVH
jgi:hypothetical protein